MNRSLIGLAGKTLLASGLVLAGSVIAGSIVPAFAFRLHTKTQITNFTNSPTVYMAPNAVTVLSNGNYVVTWDDVTDSQSCQIAIMNQNAQVLSGPITITTSCVGGPNLAALANGQFAVEFETSNQVNLQVFNSDGSAATSIISAGSGHLGSISTADNNGVLVTWTDYGPVYAEFFNSDGSARTSTIEVGSASESWYGNVAQIANDEYVVTWGIFGGSGDGQAVIFDDNGNLLSSVIDVGFANHDVFVQPLGSSNLLFFPTQDNPPNYNFSVYDISTATLLPVNLGSDVGNLPDFLWVAGSKNFYAFYDEAGGVQPYVKVFRRFGQISTPPRVFPHIKVANVDSGDAFGLMTRQLATATYAFAWIDTTGNVWTSVSP